MVCDRNQERIAHIKSIHPGIETCSDYGHILNNVDIDAVCIATPDHWHALQTIDAMKAGKDVYVEKPLTATIYEGRAMVNNQIATGRVAAVGLNRRGNLVYQKLSKMMQTDKSVN
jgi:predicted dehydrogenase